MDFGAPMLPGGMVVRASPSL